MRYVLVAAGLLALAGCQSPKVPATHPLSESEMVEMIMYSCIQNSGSWDGCRCAAANLQNDLSKSEIRQLLINVGQVEGLTNVVYVPEWKVTKAFEECRAHFPGMPQ